MATKHNSESLIKAADSEPIFVLRAQDKLAPALVRLWADLAGMHGYPIEKAEEARSLAAKMEAWPKRKYPD